MKKWTWNDETRNEMALSSYISCSANCLPNTNFSVIIIIMQNLGESNIYAYRQMIS